MLRAEDRPTIRRNPASSLKNDPDGMQRPSKRDDKSLKHAIVRPPHPSFVSGLTRSQLGRPEYERALQQHAAYCEALHSCGLQVISAKADERFPDSTFIEETAAMVLAYDADFHAKAILTRPGAPTRKGKVEGVRQILTNLGVETFQITSPGTVDGGDICETDNCFFIGISRRTNEPGAAQLREFLAKLGHQSTIVDIRGVDTILHLKSGLSYVGDNRIVVVDALARRGSFPYV